MSEAWEIRHDIEQDLSLHIAKFRLLHELLLHSPEGIDLEGDREEGVSGSPGDGLCVIISEMIWAFDEFMKKLDKRVLG